MQSSDCSLPGPFLRVGFAGRRLEEDSNVCFSDKEQVCLLLSGKEHGA